MFLTVLSMVAACTADVDGPPGLAGAEEPDCAATRSAYRITALEIPTNTAAADQLGFDLDFDSRGRPDNAAGSIYGWLGSQARADRDELATRLRTLLGDDVDLWVLEMQRCGDDDNVYVRLHRGSDRNGNGRVELTPAAFIPATGTSRDGLVQADRGQGSVPTATLVDVTGMHPGGWEAVHGLAVEYATGEDGTIDGRLGFALPEQARHALAAPLDFRKLTLAQLSNHAAKTWARAPCRNSQRRVRPAEVSRGMS